MSNTDHTDAFEADLEQSAPERDRRAELQAELDALSADKGAAVATTGPADIADPDAGVIGEDEEDSPVHGDEFTMESAALGITVTLWRPTDVAVTFFQQDSASQVLDDAERLGATGDFVRDHMPPEQWRAWRAAIKAAARRNPKIGGRVFYEAVAEALNALVENVDETDEKEMDAALNREQRRAALKAKQARSKKK